MQGKLSRNISAISAKNKILTKLLRLRNDLGKKKEIQSLPLEKYRRYFGFDAVSVSSLQGPTTFGELKLFIYYLELSSDWKLIKLSDCWRWTNLLKSSNIEGVSTNHKNLVQGRRSLYLRYSICITYFLRHEDHLVVVLTVKS